MKTISAKQFQLHQSEIMKAVAQGEQVTVTFHNKPWVRLEPAQTLKPKPGSRAAFKEALKISFPNALPKDADLDEIRRDAMRKKHGF